MKEYIVGDLIIHSIKFVLRCWFADVVIEIKQNQQYFLAVAQKFIYL